MTFKLLRGQKRRLQALGSFENALTKFRSSAPPTSAPPTPRLDSAPPRQSQISNSIDDYDNGNDMYMPSYSSSRASQFRAEPAVTPAAIKFEAVAPDNGRPGMKTAFGLHD